MRIEPRRSSISQPTSKKILNETWLHFLHNIRRKGNCTCISSEKHFAYVALDFDEEMNKAATNIRLQTISYTLPDEVTVTTCATSASGCPELLFKPHCNGFERQELKVADQNFNPSWHAMIDVRRISTLTLPFCWYHNVRQWSPRTHGEGKWSVSHSPTMKIKVVAPVPEPKYAVWIGGSILASLATFPQMVITRDEYNEAGPGIVHRKCF
ncbi:actin [Histomonas meleagridis]|nr:actin [Histomonas meleagridis]